MSKIFPTISGNLGPIEDQHTRDTEKKPETWLFSRFGGREKRDDSYLLLLHRYLEGIKREQRGGIDKKTKKGKIDVSIDK